MSVKDWPYAGDGGSTVHQHFNPLAAKVSGLNFQQLEAVSRYRDPQLQVVENYSYLFDLGQNIRKFFKHTFHSQ